MGGRSHECPRVMFSGNTGLFGEKTSHLAQLQNFRVGLAMGAGGVVDLVLPSRRWPAITSAFIRVGWLSE